MRDIISLTKYDESPFISVLTLLCSSLVVSTSSEIEMGVCAELKEQSTVLQKWSGGNLVGIILLDTCSAIVEKCWLKLSGIVR